MMQIELLNVNGKCVQGICLQAPGGKGHPNMLVLTCEEGYIMCGYLNLDTAQVCNDAAAVVSGSSFEEILKNPVKAVTEKAAALGVKVGMTGAEAAAKLNG